MNIIAKAAAFAVIAVGTIFATPDYAIAKYVTLPQMGFCADQLPMPPVMSISSTM